MCRLKWLFPFLSFFFPFPSYQDVHSGALEYTLTCMWRSMPQTYPCYVKMRSREEPCSGLLTLHSSPLQAGGCLCQGPHLKITVTQLLSTTFSAFLFGLIHRAKYKRKPKVCFFFSTAILKGRRETVSLDILLNTGWCRRRKLTATFDSL